MTKDKRKKKALIQPQYSKKEFAIAIVFAVVPFSFPLFLLLSLGRGHGTIGGNTISYDSILFFAVILILQAGIIYRWIKNKGKRITGTEVFLYWIGTIFIFSCFLLSLHDSIFYQLGVLRVVDLPFMLLTLPAFVSGLWLLGWWLENTCVEGIVMPFQKRISMAMSYALLPVSILLGTIFSVNAILANHMNFKHFLSLVCVFMVLLTIAMVWKWRKSSLRNLEKAILFFSVFMCTPVLFGSFFRVTSGDHWHGNTFSTGVSLGYFFIFMSLLSILWMWIEQESTFQ